MDDVVREHGLRVRLKGALVGASLPPEGDRIGRIMLHGPAMRRVLGMMGNKDLLNAVYVLKDFDLLHPVKDEVVRAGCAICKVHTAIITDDGKTLLMEGIELMPGQPK